jgi:hypothetical protein
MPVACRRSLRARRAVLTAIVLLAGAAGSARAANDIGGFDIVLAPDQALIRCVSLDAGAPAAYRFSADVPVRFAIRAAAADAEIPSALERDGVVGLTLSFRPPRGGDWCWIWRNAGPVPARVSGSIDRL